jgi:hypothetical protein
MSDLDSGAIALLRSARQESAMPAAKADRLEADFAKRVGAAALATTVVVGGASGAAASTASLGLTTKIALAVALAAGIGTTGAWIHHERAARQAAAQAASVETVTAPVAATPTSSPISTPTATATPSPTPTLTATPTVTPTTARTPRAASTPSLENELALIGDAQAALNAGDANKALAILKEHKTRFPRGQLAQERDGMQILARCANGSAGAKAQADAFVRAKPDSALAKRIRQACGVE